MSQHTPLSIAIARFEKNVAALSDVPNNQSFSAGYRGGMLVAINRLKELLPLERDALEKAYNDGFGSMLESLKNYANSDPIETGADYFNIIYTK